MGAIEDIGAERSRQIHGEGWTPEHDDEHTDGSLAQAAWCYLLHVEPGDPPVTEWPWHPDWWKPKSRRRNLVRAAALIVAEIERLDRRAAAGGTP